MRISTLRTLIFRLVDAGYLVAKKFTGPHHPVCAKSVASQLFLDRAATPPQLRRGIRWPEDLAWSAKISMPRFGLTEHC
jgi:hypothetical protein